MKIIKSSNESVKENTQTSLFISERESALKKQVSNLKHNNDEASAVFLDFLKPFYQHLNEMLLPEQILFIGLTAWNLANIKMLAQGFYPNFKMEADEELGLPEELSIEFEKLIERKEKLFAGYPDFIVDFEMNPLKKKDENGFEFILDLTLKSTEDFMVEASFDNDDIEEIDDDNDFEDSADFETGFVDRSAVMISPKQAFVDLIKNLGSDNVRFSSDRGNVYLVTESDSNKEIEKWVKNNYKSILQHEFLDCSLDNSLWPSNVSFKTFQEWFDVKIACFAYDMEETPLVKY